MVTKIFKLSYKEFEKFVVVNYGVDNYSYISAEECCNDTEQLYSDVKGELKEYQTEDLNKFKEDGIGLYLTSTILEDLCSKGIISKGSYLITVSW